MVQKCIGVLLLSVAVTAQALHLPPLDRVLPSRADVIYQQMVVRVDPAVAMDTARMMAPLWRLARQAVQSASISDVRSTI